MTAAPLLLLISLLIIPSEKVYAEGKSQVISKGSAADKMIALTFDDGYDGEKIQEILQILKENEINATFFLTGKAAKEHPKLIKCIVADGNVVGNHSYSHPEFTKLTPEEMKKEVNKAEAIIKKLTGQSTKPYFRPPYGDYDSSVLKVVCCCGYSKTIVWTIDTRDWEGLSADEITREVLSKASPGAIVLMHAGSGAVNTPEALPDIIKGLKDEGYQFVTIPELLKNVPSDKKVYIVKSGDTLSGISKAYDVTVKQLASVNHIKNPQLINVGQVLIIPESKPDSIKYLVIKGDTLSKIAAKYGISVEQLASMNHIKNVNLIYPDQLLIIPE